MESAIKLVKEKKNRILFVFIARQSFWIPLVRNGCSVRGSVSNGAMRSAQSMRKVDDPFVSTICD